MAITAMRIVEVLVVLAVYAVAAYVAYHIRTHAIATYGKVIHEFDPWFNFRATQYLADNGYEKFFKWFDHESWYPLGRPVGTTIYPGLQITSVTIFRILHNKGVRKVLKFLPLWLRPEKMSLNDICVYVPCWFGALASIITGLLTKEVSGNARAGAVGAIIMSVIPAHLMRSIGGGYDNESVAMTTMTLTFYLWTRSLRNAGSWPIGLLAGLAYGYMVAAWGGFIFVCNMVALHAAFLIVTGYYSPSLHKAYTLWYVVGTYLATQVPVVGLSPFRSAEQLSALGVFVVLQFLFVCDMIAASRGLRWDKEEDKDKITAIRKQVLLYGSVAAIIPVAYLAQTGFFGPLSIRVRSLFIKHTKTGNPLVDSVAEHQPASAQAYMHYLKDTLYLVPVGFALVAAARNPKSESSFFNVSATKWFALLETIVTFYFANKMMRLIIFLAPVASILGGVALEAGVTWALSQAMLFPVVKNLFSKEESTSESAVSTSTPTPETPGKTSTSTPSTGGKGGETKETPKQKAAKASTSGSNAEYTEFYGVLIPNTITSQFSGMYTSTPGKAGRVAIAVGIIAMLVTRIPSFYAFADMYARQISNPSIMFKARLNNGQEVMIDDYRQAYWWLSKNTPEDARVLAWWDYGYQINGIGNRTSLADGNTWNLEHIALVGRCLALPEKKAHKLIRHLADYVLVWAGNQGDDLAKSPHIARISNSVYADVCPNDPLCKTFGFYQSQQGVKPTPSMEASLLYKLHSSGLKPGVVADPNLWEEVHKSEYGLVRIWKVKNVDQESKAWAKNPANWKCDAPGSWYCPGQYPPALPDKPPSTHRNLKYED